ncbi:hypothetical protein F7D13_07730 [Methylocystis rosea]|uniref:Uncharacterized protein n=1 Tax=Methylocystis rosea TaxID=173366 RepID=A0ABX6EJ16_9HYPH|nr:hypothetical protein F7D13_07730 [Methylocystis rosea]
MMAISEVELTEIERLLGAEATPALSDLRAKFSHLSWTRCDVSDVIETPFRSFTTCDVHLLDGADHCVTVTDDPARATGVIVAFRGSLR